MSRRLPEPIAGHLMWQRKAIFRAFRWPANWNLAHRVRGLGDMTSRAWAARMPHAESRRHLLWKTSPGWMCLSRTRFSLIDCRMDV